MWTLLALLAAAHVAATPAREPGDPAWLGETREHLRRLIRFDTSNPPGNEILVARYLKEALARDGIPAEVLVSTGTRASLIARLKSEGGKRPLILMCHTDVVPADPGEWATPPFEPVERDGYMYGRGAADIKSLCAAELSVMLWLKRSGTRLARDVVFFAQADEETGARERHIDWLLREHGELLDAEFAINEGGDTLLEGGRVAEIRVQAAEKEYMDVQLVARGQPGHAAVPRDDNPVVAIARVVARIHEHRFPARLEPVVREFFARQVETAAPSVRAALSDALAAPEGPALDEAADRLEAVRPEFVAMIRDTVTPTILRGGYKGNVIPADAEALVNARLLPGRAPDAFVSALREAIDDPSIELRWTPPGRPPVATMPTDTALFDAIREAAREHAPEARVMPYMTVWTTDGQDLRARGVVVYGIIPPFTAEDGVRMHGKDERIELVWLDWYTVFLRSVVLRVAAQSRKGRAPAR